MTTTTAVETAFRRLGEVHPHHALRITSDFAGLRPGAVVVVDRKEQTGSFFTGIKSGDRAVVTETWGTSSASVQRVDGDGAHLSIRDPHAALLPVTPEKVTKDEVRGAQRAARKAGDAALERAYASANGLLGAPAGDDAALASLRLAKDYRDLAFALGVFEDYIEEAMREENNAALRAALRNA